MIGALLRVAARGCCGGLVLAACAASGPAADGDVDVDVADSAVGIVAEGCSLSAQLGSGVALRTPGQVVTAAHPIAGAAEITVIDSAGAEHSASVLAFDKDSDLAVLDVPTLRATPLEIGSSATGPGRLLVWSRDGTESKIIEIVKLLDVTIEDIYVEEIVERTGLEISGDVQIGDSGGAVVNDGGAVVGIIYASSRERERTGFSTDDAELRDVLASKAAEPVPNGRCR